MLLGIGGNNAQAELTLEAVLMGLPTMVIQRLGITP
jgi:hypothetical protein